MPDIVTTRVFTDGEKGITATKLNDIVGSSAIQTSFVSSKPVASSTAAGDNLLLLKSGGTYAQIDSSTFAAAMVPLLPAPEPKIWSVRLRSFNAIGNPSFEVDQRLAVGNVATNVFPIDRWVFNKAGTMVVYAGQATGNPVIVPGTSFQISRAILNNTISTAQTTLGASDFYALTQTVEGPKLRELISDVHSISLLVNSSVANLKFSVTLRDNPATKSLVKLCTVPTANVWTLIQLPNIPVWPTANFALAPGAIGYNITLCFACGSTLIAPAADTWQNGNFLGAPGMSNLAATLSAFCYVGFIQHEPGSQCSNPPIDLPFGQNLDGDFGCTRYFQKSYPYAVAPGTVNSAGIANFYNYTGGAANNALTPIRYPKIMVRTPTITGYSNATGAINNIRDGTSGADRAVSASNTAGDSGFNGFTITGGVAAPINYQFHYTADTGW
jgi:hypothetical protein